MSTIAAERDPDAQLYPVEHIKRGPNIRTHFDDAKQRELTESISRAGLLNPLLCRPSKGDSIELVAGARRLAAYEALGLKVVAVRLRKISDEEMIEVQIIENSQRSDLHPMEEAEAFKRLQQEFKRSPKDIAGATGKSEAHVRRRLNLCDLAPAVKKSFLDNKFPLGIAQLLARIPNKELQGKAMAEIVRSDYMMPVDDAAHFIESEYMLRLDQASFSTTDAQLLPAAGACTTCPKRSGNQPMLFPDIKIGDTCTDPSCFKSKVDASWKRLAAEGKAKGWEIMAESKATKVFGAHSPTPNENSGFLALDCKNWNDPKGRTWGEILGSREVQLTLARDSLGGVHKLVRRGDMLQLLKADGSKPSKKEAAEQLRAAKDDEEAQKLKEARAQRVAAARLAVAEIAITGGKAHFSDETLAALARALIDRCFPTQLAQRRAKAAGRAGNATEQVPWLRQQCGSMDARSLRSLIVEIALGEPALQPDAGEDANFKAFAKIFDVKLSEVAKRIKAERAAKEE